MVECYETMDCWYIWIKWSMVLSRRILWRSKSSIRIIFCVYIWYLKLPCQWLYENWSPSGYKCYWKCQGKTNLSEGGKGQGIMINIYHQKMLQIFNTSKFMEELLKKQQKLKFSGAGASHQNGAGSRARYQYSGQYRKCHIDSSLDDMSQGNIANGNGLCCIDLKLDPWYTVWYTSH